MRPVVATACRRVRVGSRGGTALAESGPSTPRATHGSPRRVRKTSLRTIAAMSGQAVVGVDRRVGDRADVRVVVADAASNSASWGNEIRRNYDGREASSN